MHVEIVKTYEWVSHGVGDSIDIVEIKYGVSNWVISPIYDNLKMEIIQGNTTTSTKIAFIAKLNNKWGVIDHLNQTIIPFEYDYLGEFKNGVIDFMQEKYPIGSKYHYRGEMEFGYVDLANNRYDRDRNLIRS